MFEGRQVRGTGTKQPEAAPAGTKPNTIIHVAEVKQVAIAYADAENNLRTTTLVCVGGKYYVPPGAEEWTGKLAPAQDWIEKALTARDKSAGSVPVSDSVDVVT